MFKIIKEAIIYFRLKKYNIKIRENTGNGAILTSLATAFPKPYKKDSSEVTETIVRTQTLEGANWHDVTLWAPSEYDAESRALRKIRDMRFEEQGRRLRDQEKRWEEIETYIDRVSFRNFSESNYAFAAPSSLAESSVEELVFYYEKTVAKAVRSGFRETHSEWYREFSYLTMWLKDVIKGESHSCRNFKEFYDMLFQRRANYDGKYWRVDPAAISVINLLIHDLGVVLSLSPPNPLPLAEVDNNKEAAEAEETIIITRRLVVHV